MAGEIVGAVLPGQEVKVRPHCEDSLGSLASRRVLLCLTLFLAVLTVYKVTRTSQFINCDDDLYVTDNAHGEGWVELGKRASGAW